MAKVCPRCDLRCRWVFKICSTRSRKRGTQYCAANDKRIFEEYRDTEKDPRYRREDMSQEHASEFRLQFLKELKEGEGAADLARMALLIAAEDDALGARSSLSEEYCISWICITLDLHALQ